MERHVKREESVKGKGVIVFSIMGFCITILLIMTAGAVFAGPAQTGKPADVQTDFQRLEGRWVRPDGGYVLDLAEIKKDGSLKASYFNPRPINVSKTAWSRNEGQIMLFVELRDVNYPGSRYNLQYDPKSDRLTGTYFQAVEKQTFSIEFVRAK